MALSYVVRIAHIGAKPISYLKADAAEVLVRLADGLVLTVCRFREFDYIAPEPISARSGCCRFRNRPGQIAIPMIITVHNGNIDGALRKLKRQLQKDGVFADISRIQFYEKPSERRRREKEQAIRRLRKKAAARG